MRIPTCLLFLFTLPVVIAAEPSLTLDRVNTSVAELEKMTGTDMATTGIPGIAIAVVFQDKWLPPTEECQDFIRKVLTHMERDPGMSTRRIMQQSGRSRSYRLHDGFIDCKAFRQTDQYKMYFEQGGITDRIWCVFPVNQDAESLSSIRD